ncbi:MAG: FapA family protein [Candidatus Zixiibacteriota bacterium]
MEDIKPETNTLISEEIEIKVSPDKMEVVFSCQLVKGDVSVIMQNIFKELINKKITAKPDEEALLKVLNESKEQNKGINNYVLVEGIVPIMPVDGKIEWSGDYFNEEYYIDPETKRTDFHRKMGNPNVEKDVLLAKVTYDKQGKDGRDVFGKTIKVPAPKRINLQNGPNIVWNNKEAAFYSKVAGRVILTGSTVDIDETVFIKEDVGVESGNINHKGNVVINGGINSECKVEATGDIEVRGLVYASDIKCGGNLTCKEGMNESIEKKIEVKGELFSKYIMNATIESYGNIIVNSEIYQSNIKSRGDISCEEGRIVGGEIMVAKDIRTGEAGSKGYANTLLIAGVDFHLQQRLNINNTNIQKLKDSLKKLKPVYRQLINIKNFLDATQKEKLTELEFKIYEINDTIEKLEEDNKIIRKKNYENRKARIIILKMIYPGVTLRIFDTQFIVDNALAGPIVAIIDSVTGKLALTSELEENKERQ